MIAKGKKLKTVTFGEMLECINEKEVLFHYFGLDNIPKGTINSLLREDKHPSCALRYTQGGHIRYKDFATGENFSVFELCSMMFYGDSNHYTDAVNKIYAELYEGLEHKKVFNKQPHTKESVTSYDFDISVEIREWENHDIEYWNSFGISKPWLIFARIYPIRHYFYTFDNGGMIIKKADRYAYGYLERKDNKISWKIYQPFNISGRKWRNNHNRSVISLWEQAIKADCKYLCICSSTKDALCLWSNIGIPSIAIQSENTSLSKTVIDILKQKYNQVYILLDNDKPGKLDALKLASETGFKNIELPDYGAKDISDLYKELDNKRNFIQIMKQLFNRNK